MVVTSKGIKRVTFVRVMRQQYIEQQSYKKVIKLCRKKKGV